MLTDNAIPSGAVAVTASDTTAVNLIGFYVTTAGDVAIVDGFGVTTVIPAWPVAVPFVCKITTIKATGTTATGIIGMKA